LGLGSEIAVIGQFVSQKQKPITAEDAEEDRQPALGLSLFIGLGILFQGELQQPADGCGTRVKSVVEPEIFNLLEQILFQAQQNLCL
jgi:hypothetical protein